MDLFQPVTLLLENGEAGRSIAFANLRLAVLSVMRELTPAERENALILSKDGPIDFGAITQVFDALRSTQVRVAGY